MEHCCGNILNIPKNIRGRKLCKTKEAFKNYPLETLLEQKQVVLILGYLKCFKNSDKVQERYTIASYTDRKDVVGTF